MARTSIDVIVPMFNEREVIQQTHKALAESFATRPDLDPRFLYVDDGSTDDTVALVVNEIGAEHHRILRLSRNFGHQAAVAAGLAESSADLVAIIDADLQDPPQVLLQMVDRLLDGYDVVYGVRAERQEGLLKRAAYRVFYRVFRWLSDIPIPLDAGDFCVMRRRVVQSIGVLPERLRVLRGLRAWVGYRQVGFPYRRQGRFAGEPKYTFRKLVQLSFDSIFSFSTLPLRVVLYGGAFCMLAALTLAASYLVAFIILGQGPGEIPPGFTTLVLLLLFFGGAQLAGLGLVGEYLARTYLESKGRPTFIIAERLP
jgi:dolichol-phosphate mannosyltransferase